MLDQVLLDILVCPETKQPVKLAEADLLARLNRRIEDGAVTNRAGSPVTAPLEAALLREDGQVLYPVRESIPIMLLDEAIPLGPGGNSSAKASNAGSSNAPQR